MVLGTHSICSALWEISDNKLCASGFELYVVENDFV
jgi:hypothetical protein